MSLGTRWVTRWSPSIPLGLLGNASSIALATAMTAALGYAYWWLAARVFPPADVGFAAATISAMTLLGNIGVFGLGTLVISEVGRMHGLEAELIGAAVGAAGVIACALGVGFALFAPVVSPDLAVLARPAPLALFAVGVGLMAAGSVLDQALVGLLRGQTQLWRNLVFSTSKLVALYVVGLTAPTAGGLVICMTWVGAALLSMSPLVTLFARRSRTGAPFGQGAWQAVRGRMPTAMAHHVLNVGLQFTHLALPIVVTIVLSATDNAYFYVAWMMASMVFLASSALTLALYALGVREPAMLASHTRFTLSLALAMSALATVVLMISADTLLLVMFGPAYPPLAGPALRILITAAVPLAIIDHFVTISRIRGGTLSVARYVWPSAVMQLAVAALGARVAGLPGLSLGWVIGVWIEGMFMTPRVLRTAGLFPQLRSLTWR